jgi:hypothetical protein
MIRFEWTSSREGKMRFLFWDSSSQQTPKWARQLHSSIFWEECSDIALESVHKAIWAKLDWQNADKEGCPVAVKLSQTSLSQQMMWFPLGIKRSTGFDVDFGGGISFNSDVNSQSKWPMLQTVSFIWNEMSTCDNVSTPVNSDKDGSFLDGLFHK